MIGAIIVLYNPNIHQLIKAISTLSHQVDTICLVDNSSIDNSNHLKSLDKVVYFPLLNNTGIAHAQNVGLKYLIDHNFDYVIFSDQDSLASENIVDSLMTSFRGLKDAGYNIGGIAPLAYNSETGKPYLRPKLDIEKISLEVGNQAHNVVRLKNIMSSLSLYQLCLIKEVGGFDENLFIDMVESEWCWRATRQTGALFFVDQNIRINHMLGVNKKTPMGTISQSSAFRIYYQFRNYLWCSKLPYVPKIWVKYQGKKFLIKAFYYPLFCSPRLKYLWAIIMGVKDGLFSKHQQKIATFKQ